MSCWPHHLKFIQALPNTAGSWSNGRHYHKQWLWCCWPQTYLTSTESTHCQGLFPTEDGNPTPKQWLVFLRNRSWDLLLISQAPRCFSRTPSSIPGPREHCQYTCHLDSRLHITVSIQPDPKETLKRGGGNEEVRKQDGLPVDQLHFYLETSSRFFSKLQFCCHWCADQQGPLRSEERGPDVQHLLTSLI